ncbi:hypothetical protein D3C80_779410 [compost metagenome]
MSFVFIAIVIADLNFSGAPTVGDDAFAILIQEHHVIFFDPVDVEFPGRVESGGSTICQHPLMVFEVIALVRVQNVKPADGRFFKLGFGFFSAI